LKNWIFLGLWIILGVGILCWGISMGLSSYTFKSAAVTLNGTVSEIHSSLSDGVPVSNPTVKFLMPDGKEKEYHSCFSSSVQSYSIGDNVEILWEPKSGKVRLNAFGDLYFPALFAIIAAVFILFCPVFCIAVWIWIWGLPTEDNLSKMKETMRERMQSLRLRTK